jgi:hypothetical protein
MVEPVSQSTSHYPFAPADDAPRSEHEAYAKNPRAFGYTHWIGTDGKRYDLPDDFAFFWLPCRYCGKTIGGHETYHREYIGDGSQNVSSFDFRCKVLP